MNGCASIIFQHTPVLKPVVSPCTYTGSVFLFKLLLTQRRFQLKGLNYVTTVRILYKFQLYVSPYFENGFNYCIRFEEVLIVVVTYISKQHCCIPNFHVILIYKNWFHKAVIVWFVILSLCVCSYGSMMQWGGSSLRRINRLKHCSWANIH